MIYPAILKHRHVGIVVSDIKRATDFYCDVFGFKKILERYEQGDYFCDFNGFRGEANTVKLEIPDGSVLELIEYVNPKPLDRVGADQNIIGKAHQCYQVNNIFKLYDDLSSKGVKFLMTPRQSPDDPCYVASCLDADRNMIQLVELFTSGSYGCQNCDFMSPFKEYYDEHLESQEHKFRINMVKKN